MRENRLSGSEGGGIEFNRFFLPLFDSPQRKRLCQNSASQRRRREM